MEFIHCPSPVADSDGSGALLRSSRRAHLNLWQSAGAMATPLPPDVILRSSPSPQAELPLAAAGVQRWLWEGRFGAMLIEVVGNIAYVNGDPVQSFDRTASFGLQPTGSAAPNSAQNVAATYSTGRVPRHSG